MSQAQLRFNGKAIIHDDLTGQWLCTAPESCFDTDYEATVTIDPDSGWSGVEVDGVPVGDGQSVWICPLNGTTPHSLRAKVGGSVVEGNLLFTFLPVLEVNATLTEEYLPGQFKLHLPDDAPMSLQGLVKWRGRTTMMVDRHKRNFHIKLQNSRGDNLNIPLLGMRSDDSWILDAGQIDLARVRNRVAQELWLDIAAKPYYADHEPEARSAVRGEWIELVVNGNYEGIYSLTEAMDRKQMQLAKYESRPDTIIHGQLWKASVYGKETTFQTATPYDNTKANWAGFDTKYPDLTEVSPTDYSILHNAVSVAQTMYDRQWRTDAGIYFDLPVMRDYIILTQVLLAVDNYGKNLFWAVYDREQDCKLTLAVWDLDCTVGQNWDNSTQNFRPNNIVGPERKLTIGNNAMWRMYALINSFKTDVMQRYGELRRGALHNDSLIARYMTHIELLQHAGAAARESARWNGDSDLGGHNLDWEAEKEYIRDWITRRFKYLDTNTFAEAGIEAVHDSAPPADDNIYDLLGRRCNADNLPPGIYIRHGKKVVIR